MCEIPNNVIDIDNFAALLDGFSIGSNDLTQLTLGADRDSDIVVFDFDEPDPGMLTMLRLAVEAPSATGAMSGFAAKLLPITRRSRVFSLDWASTRSASTSQPAAHDVCRLVHEAEETAVTTPVAAE